VTSSWSFILQSLETIQETGIACHKSGCQINSTDPISALKTFKLCRLYASLLWIVWLCSPAHGWTKRLCNLRRKI